MSPAVLALRFGTAGKRPEWFAVELSNTSLQLSGRFIVSGNHLAWRLLCFSGLWEIHVPSIVEPAIAAITYQYWCQLGSGLLVSMRIRSSLLVPKCSSLPWVVLCDLIVPFLFMWTKSERNRAIDERLLSQLSSEVVNLLPFSWCSNNCTETDFLHLFISVPS